MFPWRLLNEISALPPKPRRLNIDRLRLSGRDWRVIVWLERGKLGKVEVRTGHEDGFLVNETFALTIRL